MITFGDPLARFAANKIEVTDGISSAQLHEHRDKVTVRFKENCFEGKPFTKVTGTYYIFSENELKDLLKSMNG